MRSIYVSGTFDGAHAGHIELIKDAEKIVGLEGKIYLAVNSDAFVKDYKGVELMFNQRDRSRMIIEHITLPYQAFTVNYEKQAQLLNFLRPTFMIHGTDWVGESLLKNFGVNHKWLEDRGITMVYTDRRSGMSSTYLRQTSQNASQLDIFSKTSPNVGK